MMKMTVTAVVMKADFQRWSRCDMMQTVTKVSQLTLIYHVSLMEKSMDCMH